MFAETLSFICADAGEVDGKIRDLELEMFLAIPKKGL